MFIKVHPRGTLSVIRFDGGIVCECGNTPESLGFVEVFPRIWTILGRHFVRVLDGAHPRWQGHYACDQCRGFVWLDVGAPTAKDGRGRPAVPALAHATNGTTPASRIPGGVSDSAVPQPPARARGKRTVVRSPRLL